MKLHQLYKDIEVSSEVLVSSQHRQIQLLFEKCIQQIESARHAMLNREFANKHLAIGKATEILKYLRMCLNFNDQRTISMSNQLDELYAHVTQCLLTANLNNDPKFIDQALRCLTMVKEGWDQIS
jgi:flagellar secretion chaperone FliS